MNEECGGALSRFSTGGITIDQIKQASILILTLLLCAISATQSDTFFTWTNLVENMFTNAAGLGIIAIGMTFVMIGGGFDLSVAATAAVCSIVTQLALERFAGMGPMQAIAIALFLSAIAGTILGAVNGALISYVRVNPFVVTLSTMLIFRGLALILSDGGQSLLVPLEIEPSYQNLFWGRLQLPGMPSYPIPVPIAIFAGVFVAGVYLLRYTRFGHYVYALGGNESATYLAGIDTTLIKAATYTICGFCCAVAGSVFLAVTNTAEAASFQGDELIVIAAVIVGGTPLGGGRGGLFLTLNGLLLLYVIENLLVQFGVREEYMNIVRGTIILSAVAVDVWVARGKDR